MAGTILIIDDEPAIRRSFELVLRVPGRAVLTAESGERGLELLAERGADLVFLDLNMPGLDGVDTLLRIRETHPSTPVYIVTAFAAEYMERLSAASARGVEFELLRKPIGAGEIRAVAEAALGGGATRVEGEP